MWTGQSDSEKQWTLVDFSFCCFGRSHNQNDSWICESLNFHLTRRMNKHQFLSNQQTCSWFQRVCGNQCEWLVRQSLLYKENKPNLNRQQHHPLCTRFFFFFFLLPPPLRPPSSSSTSEKVWRDEWDAEQLKRFLSAHSPTTSCSLLRSGGSCCCCYRWLSSCYTYRRQCVWPSLAFFPALGFLDWKIKSQLAKK